MDERAFSAWARAQSTHHIRSGATGYNVGTGVWFGEDTDGTVKWFVGDASGNKVTWDGSALSITGTITATTGTIGGWTLGSTDLTSGSGANTVGLDSGGTNPAIYAGSATPASAPFRVTQAGALTATNATITGSVTSTSGSIGGWTLSANALSAGSGANSVLLDSGGTNPAIAIGSATPASAPFRVTTAGALTATSATITGSVTSTAGTIGGWTLAATSLTSGTGATTVGIDSGGTNPAFYAGSATPASAPFRVTQAGDLTATSATITGDVSGTQIVIKPANTDRTSTTTLAADPHLSKALSASATYLVEIGLAYIADSTGDGSQGFNCSFAYSGTASLIGPLIGYKTENSVISGLFGTQASPMPGGVSPILQVAGGLHDHLTARFYISTSTAGNLTVNWAQASSSANFTRLQQGSYIRATRTISL